MSKRVLLFVLASMMMSICIPACARKQQSKSVLAQYFIEIGDIQEEAKARPQGKEDYPQDTNKIPEGITVKELIFSLPSITTNRSGKLITIEGKEIVNSIKFNSQFVLPADSRHRYYKNDTKLKIGHLIADISGQWYSEDTKLNSGTVYVQINKGKKGAYIIIEYYQNVSFDLVGGNSEYVDLGLSVKWATCNVGAGKPEEYGDYYAWGETEPKDFYFWDTYKYCDGTYNSLTKYTDSAYGKDGFSDNKSVLDPEDDVAHVKWGGNWRIPTKDELEELRTKCTWTSTTLNGVKGYSVTSNVDGYTDRSIFLPATGMRIRQWTENTDTIGRFWGNSIVTGDDYEAVYLDFDFSRGPGRFSIIRCFGQCVRPVCP